MPKFTEDQQKAIDLEGKNIIVSAGAGSGKTAVLSERVLRKLKQGISISQLLVLTFTNEAAGEMKQRIRQKISKDPDLQDQLDLIDSAYITTFDSFSLSMVKKYHYLLGVDKNINIMDASILEMKKNEYLDTIFNERYEKKDENFLKLINDFCVKEDQSIKEAVHSIMESVDKLSNKKEFLTTYVDKYYSTAHINKIIEEYENNIKEQVKSIETSCLELEEEIAIEKDEELYQKIIKEIEKVLQASSYEEIKEACDFSFPRLMKVSEGFSKRANVVKEKINKLKQLTKEDTILDIKESLLSTKVYVKAIVSILLELDALLDAYKKKNNSYSFTDVALLAIDLVEKYEDVREEIKNTYNEILLDEYQDTSDLQEKFISFIEKDNLYMVGDVKQSIYRFRNANPMIFKNKYDAYSMDKGGMKLDLVKNFRSRKEVLENINLIFDRIMDDKIGGADYKKSHRMVFGNTAYLEEDAKCNHEMEVYNYTYSDKKYSKEEIEAFIIAKDIKEKVQKGYLVFDKETSKLRRCTYNDFCIIMDRGTAFAIYKKIFEYLEIPLVLYLDQKLNTEQDIFVIKNIFNLIIKIKKKELDQEFRYYFTSVMRSYLVQACDQEILTIFKENTFKETKLYKKCEEIAKDLDTLTNNQVLDLILTAFSVYEKTITIASVDDSYVRLDYLQSIASNLSLLGYTPYEFCDYLNKMCEGKNDIKYSLNNKSGDNVKIMNIHKSKGLEFPVCYFSGFHKTFNFKDVQAKFLFDSTYGIITPYYKRGIRKTILHLLAEEKYYQEEISEKIRLFYVALTRAREKMILVTSLNLEEERVDFVNEEQKEAYRSFLAIMNSLTCCLQSYIKNIDLEEIGLTKKYDVGKNIDLSRLKNNQEEEISIVDRKDKIEYIEEKHASKTLKKLITKEESDTLQFGTFMHHVFEMTDFKNVDSSLEYSSYVFAFLKHLGDLSTCSFYKEYPFEYEKENIKYTGIIDLVVKYDDHVKIIDYKLKNISDDAYQRQLNVYYNFLETKTKKPIQMYLYSILDDKFVEIKKKI